MGIIQRIAARLGYTPLTSELSTAYASRFADDALAQITLDDWLGALPESVAVTRRNALQVSTVAAARHVIASTNGRLPLVADAGGVRLETQPQLLGQVERGVPLATTMTWTYDALLFYPCTWWRVTERDWYGWPIWAEWLDRSRVDQDDAGRVVKIDGEPVKPGAPIGRRPEDVIRFDSPLGDGLLSLGRKTIQRALALDLSAALAEDNPVPTVELHNEAGVELTPDEREELLLNWSNSRRKRGVAYTPKGLKVIPHGAAPQQLLIDGRRAISLDVVRHANLPAWAASTAIEGATMTYDNRSLRNWELLDLTLAAYHTAVAGRLSLGDITPRGWQVRVDTDELTRPDEKTRFETYEIGKRAGFIDNAWIAGREGWATTPADTTRSAQ